LVDTEAAKSSNSMRLPEEVVARVLAELLEAFSLIRAESFGLSL